MKKRTIAALLCVVLVALLVPFASFAAEKTSVVPRGEDLVATDILAGQPRAYSKFSSKPRFVSCDDPDVEVPGKFAFVDAWTVEKKAGTFDRKVIFTPNDSNKYESYQMTVQLTVKVNPWPELHDIFAFGKDPDTDKPLYWVCTKIEDGNLKLLSLKGFDKLSDEIVESFFSDAEKEDIRTLHGAKSLYTTDPSLVENIFKTGDKKLTVKNEDGEKEDLIFAAEEGKRPVILVTRYSKLLEKIESRYTFN